MTILRILMAGLGVAALSVIGAACGTDDTPSSKGADASASQLPPEGLTVPPTSSASMLAYPSDAEQLVAWSDIVVMGTIDSVLGEKQIGGYGHDGSLVPVDDEGGFPVTDYEVRVEEVLAGMAQVEDGDLFVLRMFGHIEPQGGAITSVAFQLPNAGDRLLFAIGKNPDGTYGAGPQGLLDLSGDTVAFADGASFATRTSPDQLLQDIRDAASKCVGNARTRRCEDSNSDSSMELLPGQTGSQGANTRQSREPEGPLDTTWAEIIVLSLDGDMATMKVQKISDYSRARYATFPRLNVGDEAVIRVYSIAPLAGPNDAGSVATGVRSGETPPDLSQPVLHGRNECMFRRYDRRADLSVRRLVRSDIPI